MKTGEVATRLRVSSQTVRNWKDEWAKFLSPRLADSARGIALMFSDKDVRVLATVAACKIQQFTTEQIRAVLENDDNLVEIPPIPSKAEQEARAKVELIPLSVYHRERQVLITERDRIIEELYLRFP